VEHLKLLSPMASASTRGRATASARGRSGPRY